MRPPFVMILALAVAACTPRAVTPPARTFVLDSPLTPEVGRDDAQLDVSHIGTIWGPEANSGNARLRHTVSPGVTVEGEAGLLHINNEGTGGDRNGYTGRVGLVLASADQHEALAVGVGAGTSAAAGAWGGVDLGGMLSGTHRLVRPVLEADLGFSGPFDSTRRFEVAEPDGDVTTLRLPRNITAKVSLGLELGDRATSVLVGASLVRFWLLENSVVGSTDTEYEDEAYLAIGAGLRFSVD